MGRLRVCRIVFIVNYYVFQFQYGAIKRLLAMPPLTTLAYFNSNMGRLRGNGRNEPRRLRMDFNSNMGRLRAFLKASLVMVKYISIPIWGD